MKYKGSGGIEVTKAKPLKPIGYNKGFWVWFASLYAMLILGIYAIGVTNGTQPTKPTKSTVSVPTNLVEAIDMVDDSVVMVLAGGQGSGVILEDCIVTARHVVRGYIDPNSTPIRIHLKDGTVLLATDCVMDEDADLAYLSVEEEGLPFVRLSTETLAVGQRVFAVGAPAGYFQTATPCYITALNKDCRDFPRGYEWNWVNMIQLNLNCLGGQSGGPLFNMKGEVVGFTVIIHNDVIWWAVPATEVD